MGKQHLLVGETATSGRSRPRLARVQHESRPGREALREDEPDVNRRSITRRDSQRRDRREGVATDGSSTAATGVIRRRIRVVRHLLSLRQEHFGRDADFPAARGYGVGAGTGSGLGAGADQHTPRSRATHGSVLARDRPASAVRGRLRIARVERLAPPRFPDERALELVAVSAETVGTSEARLRKAGVGQARLKPPSRAT